MADGGDAKRTRDDDPTEAPPVAKRPREGSASQYIAATPRWGALVRTTESVRPSTEPSGTLITELTTAVTTTTAGTTVIAATTATTATATAVAVASGVLSTGETLAEKAVVEAEVARHRQGAEEEEGPSAVLRSKDEVAREALTTERIEYGERLKCVHTPWGWDELTQTHTRKRTRMQTHTHKRTRTQTQPRANAHTDTGRRRHTQNTHTQTHVPNPPRTRARASTFSRML